jgi:hypothetical protein
VYALAAGRAAAARRTHAGFDAACAWLAREADRPGQVLTRHPGEVYLRTGRLALSPPPGYDPSAIEGLATSHGVAYFLVDENPYANAPESPLARFAREEPGRLREVWPGRGARETVRVYEVR